MRKFTIAAAALSIALGLGAGAAHADNNRHGGHGAKRGHVEQQTHNRHQRRQIETVSARVHQRYANETVPLRRLFDLDRSYRGYRVRDVTVYLRPNASRGPVKLITNGEVVDQARPREGRVLRLRPGNDRTLGHDLGRLQLNIPGRAFIDRIDVTLRAPNGYRADVEHGHDHDRDDADRKREALAALFGLLVAGGLSVASAN